MPTILPIKTPINLTMRPPSRAKQMSTRRAKIVPPGAAIGPSTVLATRKTAMTVRAMVRNVATSPEGGKNFVVTRLDCNLLVTYKKYLLLQVAQLQ